jgi:hypothetical protein
MALLEFDMEPELDTEPAASGVWPPASSPFGLGSIAEGAIGQA